MAEGREKNTENEYLEKGIEFFYIKKHKNDKTCESIFFSVCEADLSSITAEGLDLGP